VNFGILNWEILKLRSNGLEDGPCILKLKLYFVEKEFMTEKDLKIRTRKFAVNILNFVDELPNRRSANIIGNQLGTLC
jgi:hypothetical protein